MKTSAERKFVSLSITLDDLLTLLLEHCEWPVWDCMQEPGSDAAEVPVPEDLRVIRADAGADRVTLTLESDLLPKSFRGPASIRGWFTKPKESLLPSP